MYDERHISQLKIVFESANRSGQIRNRIQYP